MRRRTIAADFWDLGLPVAGWDDVTGAAGKLPAVALVSTGSAVVQLRVLGRLDAVLLWSPTAQEVKVYSCDHAVSGDAGAVGGTAVPQDPGLVGTFLNNLLVTPWHLPDASTIAGGTLTQIGSVPLLANTPQVFGPLSPLSQARSWVFIGQTVATRLVASWSWRIRHARNAVLVQAGG
jgi:hypothetical protein